MLLFQVPVEVAILREGYLADVAREGVVFGVLAEVISKVAAPFEHLVTTINSAPEIKFISSLA